jgi:hypothetical protein
LEHGDRGEKQDHELFLTDTAHDAIGSFRSFAKASLTDAP